MKSWEVADTNCDAVREYLENLIERLDELDNDDFFGSEGWRHFVNRED